MNNSFYVTPENGINPNDQRFSDDIPIENHNQSSARSQTQDSPLEAQDGDMRWENYMPRTGTFETLFQNDAGNLSASSASVNRTRRNALTNGTISSSLSQYVGTRTRAVTDLFNHLANKWGITGRSLTRQDFQDNKASLGNALPGYLNHLSVTSRQIITSRNQTQNASRNTSNANNAKKERTALSTLRSRHISDVKIFFTKLQNDGIISPQNNPFSPNTRVTWNGDNATITSYNRRDQSSKWGKTVNHTCHSSIAPYVTNITPMAPLLAYLAAKWNVGTAENVSSQDFSNNQNTLLGDVNTYVSNSLANEQLSSLTPKQKNNGRSNFNAALKDLFSGLRNAGSITINPFPDGCTVNWTHSGLKVTPGPITTSSTPQISAQDQNSATVTQPSQDSQADSQSGALEPAVIPFSAQPKINSLAAQQCLDPRGTTTPDGGLYERLWVNVHPAHVAPGNATQLNLPLDYPDFEGGPYWTQNIDPNTNAWNGTLTGHNTNGLNSIDLPGHAHITLMPGGYIAHPINPAQPIAPSQSPSQISSNDNTYDFWSIYPNANDYSFTPSASELGSNVSSGFESNTSSHAFFQNYENYNIGSSDEIMPQDSASNLINTNSDDPLTAINNILDNNPEITPEVLNGLIARLNNQNIHTANTQFHANPLPNPQNDIDRLRQANAGQYQAPENARYQPYQNPRGSTR